MSPIIDPSKTQVKMSLAMLVVCMTTIGTTAGVYFNMRSSVAEAKGKADDNSALVASLSAKNEAQYKEILDRLSKLERGVSRIEGALSADHRMGKLDDVKAQIEDFRITLNERDK